MRWIWTLPTALLALTTALTGCTGNCEGDEDLVLNDVAFGDGRFVAVGYRGACDEDRFFDSAQNREALIRTTDDGATWHEATPVEGVQLRHVAYGDGLWLAVGHTTFDGGLEEEGELDSSTTVLASEDGETWETRLQLDGVDTPSFSEVTWTGDDFVAIVREGDPTSLRSTADGETWTVEHVFSRDPQEADGAPWTDRDQLRPSTLARVGDVVLASGSPWDGEHLARRTATGTWDVAPVETSHPIAAVRAAGGRFWGVAEEVYDDGYQAATLLVTSEDGVDWRWDDEPLPSELFDLASDGATDVALVPGRLMVRDGADQPWEIADEIQDTTAYDVAFGGGTYVAVGGGRREAVYSRDGWTWEKVDLSP